MESLIFPRLAHLVSSGVGIQAHLCLTLEPEAKLSWISANKQDATTCLLAIPEFCVPNSKEVFSSYPIKIPCATIEALFLLFCL